MIKILKAVIGLIIMPFRIRIFRPDKIFYNKKIAVVGPADSAFDHQNGNLIDTYDFVIRLNKALVAWNPDNKKYLGTKTDILFHNFYENMDSGGGGPLDWNLFKKFGVQFLIQPRYDKKGFQLMFNYFKKYVNTKEIIYVFPKSFYNEVIDKFQNYHPTRGFYALNSVLKADCSEILITGFTFFKTPYAKGYRDNIRDMEANKKHIKNQGLHNVEMEYYNFLQLLEKTSIDKILVDQKLYAIIENDSPQIAKKLKIIN
ncbi:glycosyltransferase family 29 protein [Marivirga arenosa]|uniref:Glycosyltransferase family 29 protein n=1 Tax=Marivirga arenosa TaxID=3059076 RepID=A0AA51X3M9_9BACT|nr:glycosyltransferase family 29 protein [Marivirga sp. BKB1-2]WNB16862.1 glycosyltransferase family 29 protein [Marivirga sp. BKB1-2]